MFEIQVKEVEHLNRGPKLLELQWEWLTMHELDPL